MRNIFLLPTDKPSRLYEFGGEYHLQIKSQENFRSQHIYITSDEEIKEDGDWYYNTVTNAIFQMKYLTKYNPEQDKKIILTTDQDLIKDGVQAIDDAFLEWFVKNPSCEEVEVEPDYDEIRGDYYRIVILQEETKQETLEDAAEQYSKNGCWEGVRKQGFIEGAKWQAERMYSDMEEYSAFVLKSYKEGLPLLLAKEWFEQYKKK
jgi:hypothetical protein